MAPPASTDSADPPRPPTRRQRFVRFYTSRTGRALRLLVVVVPLVWLARRIDPAVILHGVERVGWASLLVAFALQFVGSFTASFRWQWMLRAYGATPERVPPVHYLFRSNLAANYASFFPVPGADEGMRGLRTWQVFPQSRATVYAVIVAERIVGLSALLVLAAVATALAPAGLSPVVRFVLDGSALVAGILAALAFGTPFVIARQPSWRAAVARIPVVGALLADLPAPRRATDLVLPLVLSVFVHFLSVVTIWVMMSRLDPHATLGVCAVAQPVVLLGMAVPVAPTGLGQREALFALLYGFAGVPNAAAVTTSLLSFTLAVCQGAVGGLVLAGEHVLRARVPWTPTGR